VTAKHHPCKTNADAVPVTLYIRVNHKCTYQYISKKSDMFDCTLITNVYSSCR